MRCEGRPTVTQATVMCCAFSAWVLCGPCLVESRFTARSAVAVTAVPSPATQSRQVVSERRQLTLSTRVYYGSPGRRR